MFFGTLLARRFMCIWHSLRLSLARTLARAKPYALRLNFPGPLSFRPGSPSFRSDVIGMEYGMDFTDSLSVSQSVFAAALVRRYVPRN